MIIEIFLAVIASVSIYFIIKIYSNSKYEDEQLRVMLYSRLDSNSLLDLHAQAMAEHGQKGVNKDKIQISGRYIREARLIQRAMESKSGFLI